MRSLVYYVATTIDGRIAAADGSADDFTTDPGFLTELHRTYADALPGLAQEAMGVTPPLSQWDTVLMGRSTYAVGLDAGVTSPYPHLDQFVFSRTLDPARCEGVTVVADDPLAFTRDLKSREGGRMWLCGGGRLAATLAEEIDELIVKINPVTIGSGIPLFGGDIDPIQWTLTGSRAFEAGVLLAEYRRVRE